MRQYGIFTRYYPFLLTIICVNPVLGQADFPTYLAGKSWDSASWSTLHSEHATIELTSYEGIKNDGLEVTYDLHTDSPDSSGWVIIHNDDVGGWSEDTPIVLFIKTAAESDIELKFIDDDGSVFLTRYSMKNHSLNWNLIVLYLRDTEYGWGGDSSFGNISAFEVAFSGEGSGSVWIDEIGIGKQGLLSGFFFDPYCELEGYGFLQRRDLQKHQEDSLVLEYLKTLQDSSSSGRLILPNQDHLPLVSTYNNGLAAMVFIIKNQKERAERILDFYASRTDSNNQNSSTQAFFVNREARGFYQQIQILDYSRGGDREDRWIGDNAWLVLAYEHYQRRFGVKPEYENAARLICNLLKSFFKPVDPSSGYIQTGWQDGDTFFDTSGHVEGNIDCYAALKSCGDEEYTDKIRTWLATKLRGNDLPLDNYTWRALAFCVPAYDVISVPEYDLRFRKKIIIHGDSLYGFYPSPNSEVNNIWTEGIGHMACAQWYFGDRFRAYFYANQFDPLILRYTLYGKAIATVPYAVNRTGEYAWVDTAIGAVSSSAWYIFAKNGFNPMSVDSGNATAVGSSSSHAVPQHYELRHNFPNPFNPSTNISFTLPLRSFVSLKVYDMLGREVATLVAELLPAGSYSRQWNASNMASGVYFCRLQAGDFIDVKKLVLLR